VIDLYCHVLAGIDDGPQTLDGSLALAHVAAARGTRKGTASCSPIPSDARPSQRDPELLESLVRGGVLTSITAGSLVGRFGGSVQRFARDLIEAEMVHNVASDSHDPSNDRQASPRSCARQVWRDSPSG